MTENAYSTLNKTFIVSIRDRGNVYSNMDKVKDLEKRLKESEEREKELTRRVAELTDLIENASLPLQVQEFEEKRKALEESNKRMYHLFMQSPFAITILEGPDFVIELANDRALELLDRTSDQLLNKKIFDIFPELIHQGFKQILENVYQTGTAFSSDENAIQLVRDGKLTEVYVNFVYEAIRDTDDSIYRIIGMGIDVTAQVLARQQTEEAETRSRLAIEAADMGAFDWDMYNQHFITSPRVLEIFGFKEQPNTTHQDLIDTIHPEDKPTRDKAVADSYVKGSLVYEARIIWTDGSLHWVRIYGKVQYDEGKKLQRMYGLVTDITRQKIAVEKLKISEERLRMAIESTHLGTWDYNPLTGELNWSEECRKIYAAPVGIAIDFKKFSEHIHPEDKESVEAAILKSMEPEGIGSYDIRYRILRFDDFSVRWIRAQGTVFFNKEMEAERFMGTVLDITDEKQREIDLRTNAERIETILESLPQMAWTATPNGEVSYFSQSWCDYTGQTLEEALGNGWGKALHPDYIELTWEIWSNSLKTGNQYEMEYKIRRGVDGQYRWMWGKGIPLRNSEGAIYQWVGTVTDIHELKTLEERLIEAAGELEATNEELTASNEELAESNTQLSKTNADLDNFIYTASHDLKAPMSNIEGLLYSLRDCLQSEKEQIDEDADYHLQLMENSINRFKSTLLDLTEISKVQKVQEEDVVELDISEILEDVKLSIADQISSSGTTIYTDFSKSNTIQFSKKNLKSIVYNLLSNAIKYKDSKRKSEIYISTEKMGGYTLLSIKDNGLGISLDNQGKMFSMFKRFHNHVEGTGIGLYIVKRMIDNAGGKIEVESQVEVGTTFKVYFLN